MSGVCSQNVQIAKTLRVCIFHTSFFNKLNLSIAAVSFNRLWSSFPQIECSTSVHLRKQAKMAGMQEKFMLIKPLTFSGFFFCKKVTSSMFMD